LRFNPKLDGAIVTNDFPVFSIAEQRVLPAYLGWLSRTASFVEECLRASEGTTNRVAVYISYLRDKIDEGRSPKLIQTVYGVGYRLSG